MRFKTLSLENFRNFERVGEIVFPDHQNLLVAAAPNATGKTNFLEAVYFLLRGKSFRALPAECVTWGEEYFQIGARVATKAGDVFLSARYATKGGLRLLQDEEPVSLLPFYRDYPFILFLPEDAFLFVRGPAGRRNFLNSVLMCSPTYIASLVQYHRILKQRNAAFKKATKQDDVLVWTQLLVEQAQVIWAQRQALVQFFNTHLASLYQEFSGAELSLVVELVMGMPRGGNDLLAALNGVWDMERRYQYTMYGPHRDDVLLVADGRSAKVSLSRGQMRLLVLALKILAWRYIKQTTGEAPMILMDEVLSELDETRQRKFLDALPSTQTLFTCTSLPSELKRRDEIYHLDLGTILREPVKRIPAAVAVAV